jgi:hypothetical protein
VIKGIRIHSSSKPLKSFLPPGGFNNIGYAKPPGLWYGYRDEWLRWCISEQYADERYSHFYAVDVSKVNLLTIDSEEQLLRFEQEYGCNIIKGLAIGLPNKVSDMYFNDINWEPVMKKYDGIEIIPYIWSCRLTHLWYYGWDVASGVVWGGDPTLTKLKTTHKFLKKYMRNKAKLKSATKRSSRTLQSRA